MAEPLSRQAPEHHTSSDNTGFTHAAGAASGFTTSSAGTHCGTLAHSPRTTCQSQVCERLARMLGVCSAQPGLTQRWPLCFTNIFGTWRSRAMHFQLPAVLMNCTKMQPDHS